MAARVCQRCGIAFPLDIAACLACGDDTQQDMRVWCKPDWREKAEAKRAELLAAVLPEDPTTTLVVTNRVQRFLAAGADWDLALELAGKRRDLGGYQVDVAEFEGHVSQGCSPSTAARILL